MSSSAGKLFQVYTDSKDCLSLALIQQAKALRVRVTQTSQSQHTKEMLRYKTWVIIPEQNAGTSLLSLWLGQGFEVGLLVQHSFGQAPLTRVDRQW